MIEKRVGSIEAGKDADIVISDGNIMNSENVETLALNGISLGIDKGEMIAVAGPSGSGKTTLLNIIGGMDRLTEGKYLFQGEDTGTYNDRQLNTYRKENVGFIFQSFELMNRYNVYENIEMPLLVRNVKNTCPDGEMGI